MEYHNYGGAACNNVQFYIPNGLSGTGGNGTVTNVSYYPGPTPGPVPPFTSAYALCTVQLSNLNPGGGDICFQTAVNSECCGPDSMFCCITVPPCSCNYGNPEIEPNDTRQTAENISCPDTLCGRIQTSSDKDWYSISLSNTPCSRITIEVFSTFLGTLDPQVTLYQSNGSSVVSYNNDMFPGANDSRIQACVAQGNYFFKVEAGVPNSGSQTGPYLLVVTCEPCSCSTPCVGDSCLAIPAAMFAWWPLDETGPNISLDVAGQPSPQNFTWSTGTSGNLPQPQPGVVDNGLCFDGGNVALIFNNASAVPLNVGTGYLTIDCWMKADQYPPTGEIAAIIGREEAFTRTGYMLYLDDAGYVHGRVSDGTHVVDVAQLPSCGPMPLHTWQMVALVVQPPTLLKLYTGCGTCLSTASLAGISSLDPPLNANAWTPFSMGSAHPTMYFFGYTYPGYVGFRGCLDEVEFFKIPIGQGKVQAICNTGANGKCKLKCAVIYHDVHSTYTTIDGFATLQICNKSSVSVTVSSIDFIGTTPSLSCPYAPPTNFHVIYASCPNYPTLNPGECCNINYTFTAAPGMGPANTACYQIAINLTNGDRACVSYKFTGPTKKQKWSIAYSSPLSVPVGSDSMYTFMLHNIGDSSGVLNYTLSISSQDSLFSIVKINGLDPGVDFDGSASIALGDSMPINVLLQFTEPEFIYTYDLNFGSDDEGDGEVEFGTTVGLHSWLPPVYESPQAVVISRDSTDGIRLDWEAAPNATMYTVYSAAAPDGPWDLVFTTDQTTWTDTAAPGAFPKRFYYVTAQYSGATQSSSVQSTNRGIQNPARANPSYGN